MHLSTSANRRLALLIFASVAMLAAAAIVRLGLGNTPYETTDSLGRSMGFNDPLHAEHYAIMVSNFRVGRLFRLEHLYEWMLLVAQVVGAWLLISKSTTKRRATRWYFAAQWLLFPMGVFFIILAPFMTYGFLMGQKADRETFVDIPFVMAVGQGSWLVVATMIAMAMKGPGLGIRSAWRRIAAFIRSKVRPRACSFPLVLAVISAVALARGGAAEGDAQTEINYLLKRVESFEGKFIRGGTEYTPKEAADHLRSKLGKAGKRVKSAEDFISGIASKSYLSGKPYQMKSASGKVEAAGPWLTAALQQHRERKTGNSEGTSKEK